MTANTIITGDIVNSRELTPKNREELYDELNQYLRLLMKEQLIADYTVYRGDSFQCVLQKKEMTLRVMLIIRSFVRSFRPADSQKQPHKNGYDEVLALKGSISRQDIRLSAGIGKIDFYKPGNLTQADGEAFWLSGEKLDLLKHEIYHMALTTSDNDFNDSLEPSILLLDAVLQKWTNNQAETILYKLRGLKEEEIAKKLGITQPAVNQRIRTSQWFAIDKLLTYFEKQMKKWPQ